MSGAAAGAGSSAPAHSANDAAFIVDKAALEKWRADKSWQKDGKFFHKVKVSAAAAMKMTTHAAAGVEKGLRSANHMPVEVMGLILGHPDLSQPGTLVVTDVFPLPVEGTETTVMTDNPQVQNYMINLSDSLEHTRSENFMGWYHSHPFDVGVYSNAFLSATDVSTQLSWQISEDRAGNPWLALVVDPLRGIAKGRPEIGGFRCYPTDYTPPKGLAPDGVVWADERERNARWGESCVSYYSLEVEYFLSSSSASLFSLLSKDVLWARTLAATPMPEEARERLPERIKRISDKVGAFEFGLSSGTTKAFAPGLGAGASLLAGGSIEETSGASAAAAPAGTAQAGHGHESAVAQASQAASELASEHARAQSLQAVKHAVFNVTPGPLQSSEHACRVRCGCNNSAMEQVRRVLEERKKAARQPMAFNRDFSAPGASGAAAGAGAGASASAVAAGAASAVGGAVAQAGSAMAGLLGSVVEGVGSMLSGRNGLAAAGASSPARAPGGSIGPGQEGDGAAPGPVAAGRRRDIGSAGPARATPAGGSIGPGGSLGSDAGQG